MGTFAVQLAKVFDAEVTGVCSTRNVEMVRSLGADHVFDYTREDFIADGGRYDQMIDNVCSRSFSEYRRILTSEATVVIVGGPKRNRLLGPLSRMVKSRLAAIGKSQTVLFFLAKLKKDDMMLLHDLLETGKVTPVIDRRYELSDVADAFRYLGEGHARAKLVIAV